FWRPPLRACAAVASRSCSWVINLVWTAIRPSSASLVSAMALGDIGARAGGIETRLGRLPCAGPSWRTDERMAGSVAGEAPARRVPQSAGCARLCPLVDRIGDGWDRRRDPVGHGAALRARPRRG